MNVVEAVQDLNRTIAIASAAWAIHFKIYAYREKQHELAIPTRVHNDFFDVISASAQCYVIMNLDNVLAKRKDIKSLVNLLRIIRQNRMVPDDVGEKLSNALNSLAKERKGLGILRGNVFGHRILMKDPYEEFRLADLKFRDVDTMIDVSADVLREIALQLNLQLESSDVCKDNAIETLNDALQILLDRFNGKGQ